MQALLSARCTGVRNKDRYQSTSARRALALLNSRLVIKQIVVDNDDMIGLRVRPNGNPGLNCLSVR